MRAKRYGAAGLVLAAALTMSACGSSGGGSGNSSAATTNDWSKAQSVSQGGGMSALVQAAKKEGTLNLIAVPRDWAGYGAIIDTFKKKYGIKINSENPGGASADEITAILFEQDAALQPAAPSPTRRGRDVAKRLDDESASTAGPRRRIH